MAEASNDAAALAAAGANAPDATQGQAAPDKAALASGQDDDAPKPPSGPPPAHLLAAAKTAGAADPSSGGAGDASGASCTACGVVRTAAWRLDRETRARLCNKCYYKRYPIKTAATAEASADAKATVRRDDATQNGLEAAARREDPTPNGLEAAEEKDMKDRKELKKEKKEMKKEKKEKKDRMDGDAEEAAVEAEEVAMDADDESSKRKREQDAIGGGDDAGDALKEGKKRKKKKKNKDIDGDADLFDHFDLEQFPKSLHLESSGKATIDGRYEIQPDSKNKMPVYMKNAVQGDLKNKVVFLYFKDSEWVISTKCGAGWDKGALAHVPRAGEQQVPTEPYPNVWQVKEKEKSEDKKEGDDKGPPKYTPVLAMRVIDGQLYEAEKKQASSFSKIGVSSSPKKASKVDAAAAADTPAQDAQAVQSGGETAASAAKEASVETAKAAGGAEGAQEEAQKEEESEESEEEEPAEAAPSSDSSVKSSSDSSSDSESEAKPAQAQTPATPAPNAAPTAVANVAQPKAAPAPQRSNFEQRCRAELEKTRIERGREALAVQLQKIGDSMRRRTPEDLKKTGLTHETLRKMLEDLDDWFLGSRHRSMKPEDQPSQMKVGSSRKPSNYERKTRRLSWNAAGDRKDIQVQNWRQEPNLWYQNPGAMVECDNCNTEVPQTAGCLAGKLGYSQFAQDIFYCQTCYATCVGLNGTQEYDVSNG